MKKILITGLIAGCILFILSYGGLYLGVRYFPGLFVDYDNPLFNSDGSRDILFYLHAFIISFALSWFWDRFKALFKGTLIIRGLEFGFVYSVTALLPVIWILRLSWWPAGFYMDWHRPLLQDWCSPKLTPNKSYDAA